MDDIGKFLNDFKAAGSDVKKLSELEQHVADRMKLIAGDLKIAKEQKAGPELIDHLETQLIQTKAQFDLVGDTAENALKTNDQQRFSFQVDNPIDSILNNEFNEDGEEEEEKDEDDKEGGKKDEDGKEGGQKDEDGKEDEDDREKDANGMAHT